MGQAQRIAHQLRAWRQLAWTIVCLLIVLPVGGHALASESTAASAVAVRISDEPSRTRFIVDLTHTVSFKVYVLPDPYRVIVDLPDIEFRLPADSGGKATGLLAGYRYGSLELGRSRIVMDATQPVLIERSFILHPRDGEPARLVIDLVATDGATFARMHRSDQLSLDQATASAEEVPTELPPISIGPPPATGKAPPRAVPEPGIADPERLAALDSATSVPRPRPKPGPERAVADADAAPATEPANGRRVVVIDPGHGGIDPGAISRGGTAEKDVVLAFSEALKAALEASGHYDVHLTRSEDVFLSLRERVQVARQHNAQLFIAIHADSLSRGAARGATVYTLADKASDAEAEALAHKENRSDIIAGVDLVAESEQITGILIDLAQREAKNHAVIFAKHLVNQLKPVTRLNSRPIRSAGFRVLMAPDVPSVLFELGYLSNRSDETLLLSPEWRSEVATAMAAAVDRYFATQIAAGE
jgi:N-acetylmuramoyl-L-alanine amidase